MSARPSSLFFAGHLPVVLASASPARRWPEGAEAGDGVRALALVKAQRLARRLPSSLVIGADTVVVARGVRLGKPADAAAALAMLERLQGRSHEVWTGIALVHRGERRTASECTRVQFARLDPATLRRYVRSGEPLGKAGAYAIQGLGGQFVRRIEGDYTNVVGLPLARLRLLLAEFA